MTLGELTAEDADKNVVEAARLLVGDMVRNRPYMMLMHDGEDEQVIGYFHTLHDLHRFGRHHQIMDYSIWSRVGASKTHSGENYEEDEDHDEDQGSQEQEDEALEEEVDDELPSSSSEHTPPTTELDDLLGTNLSDLDGEELDDEEF